MGTDRHERRADRFAIRRIRTAAGERRALRVPMSPCGSVADCEILTDERARPSAFSAARGSASAL
jgi:hypothetical protein